MRWGWDYEKVPLWQNYVTPAALVTALNSPGATTSPNNCLPAAGGYAPGMGNCYLPNVTYAQLLATSFPGDPATNINDYISTGSNR